MPSDSPITDGSLVGGDPRLYRQGEQRPSIATGPPVASDNTIQPPLTDKPSTREEKTDSINRSVRLYFESEDLLSLDVPQTFHGVPDYQPFIKVVASRGYTDLLLGADIEGVYNISMIVNLNNLIFDRIESISITQHDSNAPWVFAKQELQDHSYLELFKVNKTKDGVLNLVLYPRQRKVGSTSYPTLKIEIRPSSQDDSGYIELDHIDLDPPSLSTVAEAVAIFIPHQPVLWSIDAKLMGSEGNTTDSKDPAPQIIHYALSGDDKHVATLATNGKRLQLDIWNLARDPHSGRNMGDNDKFQEPFFPTSYGSHPASFKDDILSQLNSNNLDAIRRAREDLRVSISYDASTVIFMCARRRIHSDHGSKISLLADAFQAFTINWPSSTESKELSQHTTLKRNEELGGHKNYFSRFGGFGKFHCTSPKYNAKDEVFITCDRKNINIFNVVAKWEHIRQICHDSKYVSVTEWHTGVEGIGGKYIVLQNEQRRSSYDDHHVFNKGEKIMSIYDLETGKLVHAVPSPAVACLSNDGCLMLCSRASGKLDVTTKWAGSEVVLATTQVDLEASAEFIGDGSRIFVFPVKSDPDFGQGTQGIILDSTTLAIVDRVSYPTGLTLQRPRSTGTNDQYLYSVHGTKLDSLRLQDVVRVPYPHPRIRCDTQCVTKLEDLRWDIKKTADTGTGHAITVGSGLAITVVVVGEGFVVVSVSSTKTKDDKDDNGKRRELLRIPPLNLNFTQEEERSEDSNFWSIIFHEIKKPVSDPKNQQAPNHSQQVSADSQGSLRWRVHVDKVNLQLIVDCERCIIVWKLPTTFEGTVRLQSAFWTTKIQRGNDLIYRNHDMPNRKWYELKKCSHGRTYAVLTSDGPKPPQPATVRHLRCDRVFDHDPHLFFDGLFVLIPLFDRGDDAFKEAIMQYIGHHINRTGTYKLKRDGKRGELSEDFPETIMSAICRSANKINYAVINTFLKDLLKSDHVRWVPRQCQEAKMNPIVQLLLNAYNYPIVINLARIMIDYCIDMAKKEKDWHFMIPVLGLFSMEHIKGELKELPSDLVPKILETVAYFPVKEKSFVINHAIMIHPPRKGDQPIYAHKAPILQLDDSTLFKEYSSLNDNTTRDLYVASFDLLWYKKTQGTRSSIEGIKRVQPAWWPDILLHLLLLKFKLTPHASVVRYNFPLEMLDNPAISAMIDYKWNTIGYLYWVSRFFWQCVFYVLVLVAVFMQVYDSIQSHSIKGVFIAIIAMASIFLVLEFHQFVSSPRQYISDFYNFVDIVAFALPLAGSALQLINIRDDNNNGDISTLSFSVLFIFLHILFELRVIKSVCHFVAIIVSIISKIRVFFFIFAAGILAFTTAILHLLRGCPVGDCSNKKESLKFEFPKDFHRAFSTTYFFMGGIWDSVGDDLEKADWMFHVMMILYFFFTSILLLNVLIGLREHYPLFPEKIYYFASDKEKKEYRAKYFPVDLVDINGGQEDLKKQYETKIEELKQQHGAKHEELKQELQQKMGAVENQLLEMTRLLTALQPKPQTQVCLD
ncbi:hypothetical protein BGX34_008410 [Mortierella sp. NVP85]|nr:hypothetical protein BGX34_008410 [Mortierella sp. NVP85]